MRRESGSVSAGAPALATASMTSFSVRMPSGAPASSTTMTELTDRCRISRLASARVELGPAVTGGALITSATVCR